MKSRIPIVLAADNNYRYPLMVTMLSAIMNADTNTEYQFIILISDEFEVNSKKMINELLQQYNMPEAIFYNMGKSYDEIKMQIKHISHATFYRLQLPKLLKKIEKCIYLDVDIVVKKDLKEFFNIDMEDKYIAGVKAAGYYYPEEKKEKNMQMLEIATFDQYINAGVLILNLKKMREDNLSAVFQQLLEKNFPSQDQDILNAACYNHIKILPIKYNAMTKYNVGEKDAYDEIECLPICYTREEWNEACESPVIIHYADRWKPWQDLRGQFVEEWWEYAMELEKKSDYSQWLVRNIAAYQTQVISDLKNKRSEINAKLQQTYAEKSEINAKLQQTYAEKSEINAKLHETYKQKSERGEKIKKLRKNLKNTQTELEEKSKRLEQLEKEKKELEKHFLGRAVQKLYNK